GDRDKFVRTAARLVLQRIDRARWVNRIAEEKDDRTAFEAIVALCKVGGDGPDVMARLDREIRLQPGLGGNGGVALALMQAHLRTIQLALLHTTYTEKEARAVAARCLAAFPQANPYTNRELVILLAHFQMKGLLDTPPQAKILAQWKLSSD